MTASAIEVSPAQRRGGTPVETRRRMARLIPFRRRPKTASRLDIDALYRQYAGMVLRRVRRFFGESDAEEVVHEVFLRAMEKGDTFRGDASPSTWLYHLTTNHCLNRIRNRKRRRTALAINADLPWLKPASGTDAETSVFLAQLWSQLDDEAIMIATYYFVDGMSHDEIARILGVSRRTVGNRVEGLRAAARAAAGLS